MVANCAMNRERSLSGSNGYGRELGVDVIAELIRRSARARVRWLDLCCGSGHALAEAARLLAGQDVVGRVEIVGLDLVDHFAAGPFPPALRLVTGSVTEWAPDEPFDLITCVHGCRRLSGPFPADEPPPKSMSSTVTVATSPTSRVSAARTARLMGSA